VERELKILVLEDSAEDYEIELRELRKAGLRFVSRRVETMGEFEREMAAYGPDLILCDHQLPTTDGHEAIRAAREKCPETPLLIVSGSLGEDQAVECIKRGAVDYIVKGRFASLGVRVRRALEEAQARAERHKLEEQYRHAQKMEAIGRLAGGIAHDLNNVLTAILGYSQLWLAKLPPDDPNRNDVVEIEKAGQRAASLTRRLLAFSRKQVLSPRVINLNAVVRDVERLLRRVIGEDVELVTTLEPSLWNVKADPAQVEQVIMNLAVNARDAMPRGGRLTIGTNNMAPDVTLWVSDTGTGIAPEIKTHLFEPFFTTKGLGRGTGLGLSTVYGIVTQSGGRIAVQSEQGKGTTFRIYLPRVLERAEPLPQATPRPGPAEGRETILLVEDDDVIRALAASVLRAHGYTVLAAPDGIEGARAGAEHKGKIDLLITDLVMPRMDGRTLARELTARRPGLKVLLMSGYSAEENPGDEAAAALRKPFTPRELLARAREVLDGTA
jgi:signal transduction histidine kinase